MKYIKTSFKLEPDSPINREIAIAYLSELDFESFDETEETIEGYFPESKVTSKSIETILKTIPFTVTYSFEEQPDINWNTEWEKNYFQPVLINHNCLIRAPFHTDYPSAEYEIIINPNMAFGTGNHQTTSLMIQHIQTLDTKGKNILDMGCGTGILGIFAALKGCAHVNAIDIDQWCVDSTIENCKLNHIHNLDVQLGDAHSIGTSIKYDIILANIQRNIILKDIEKYLTALNPEGYLIVSGFFKNDAEIIQKKAEKLGLHLIKLLEQDNWAACAFRK